MGLKLVRVLAWSLFFSSPAFLAAAPVLRLVSSTVGPVAVAPGSSGGTQTVEAFNAGDGGLTLSVTSSVTWIAPSIGGSRNCTTTTQVRTCSPIQLALNTQGLAAGTFTGIVRVTDPNAVDAPQTITVTVRVGGIDLYVAPGTSREVTISTTSSVATRTTTQDGSGWLTVSLDGTGSFRFSYPYRVKLQAGNSQAQGTYTGSIVTSGSPFAPDNLTIPVTMRVTAQPIAEASPDQISVRLAQGAPALTTGITLKNGVGTGFFSGVATATGGSWLTATGSSSGATVTMDAGSMAPGTYTGSVAIASNTVNGTLTVPVQLEVVAKGAPEIRFQGVVDNGTFGPGDTVARGDVMAILGEQFSFGPLTVGTAAPLATEVGGTTVLVNGTPAPLYYSSYGQVAFQMPVDAPLGTVLVQVRRDGLTSNTAAVTVAQRAPRLLSIGTTGFGAIVNAVDGSLPMPVGSLPGSGFATHPAKPGDTLTIYAIGLGPTNPTIGTGLPAPSPPSTLAETTVKPTVNFGGGPFGVSTEAAFSGLTPTYAGLYQVNVTIPPDAPKGTIPVSVGFADSASNAVQIVIQ